MRQRTVLALARLADAYFTYSTMTSVPAQPPSQLPMLRSLHYERVDWFSDFLFEKEYPANVVRTARELPAEHGAIKRFVIRLWEDYESLFLQPEQPVPLDRTRGFARVAGDLLEYASRPRSETLVLVSPTTRDAVLRELELDGYSWKDGQLILNEENVFDIKEQEGAFMLTYRQCGLERPDRLTKELKDIDDQYVASKWGDSIKHARDLLELLLLSIARAWATRRGENLPGAPQERPVVVRDYLRGSGLIEEREREFLNALYKLLSDQGGHPNMAAQESARICRQYVLSAAHFLVLRYQALSAKPPPTGRSPM